MYQEWIDSVAISPLFHDIRYKKIDKILNYLKPRVERYKKQEIIVFSGQAYNGVGIVTYGRIAVTSESSDGSRVILDIREVGDIIGEMTAFSDNKEWSLTIVAQEDSCLLFFPLDKFVRDYDHTSICRNILIMNLLAILSDHSLVLSKKIDYLSVKAMRSKLSMYLLDMYRKTGSSSFTIPMKRHELADYLSVTRPALSKEMCLMRDEGIIEFNGCSVTIKKPIELQDCVWNI
jgi:CRP-like cAMP-binding protein